ncbi:MAG: putative periplasmic protein [Labilithrix sp.]|nr:putative periplasmic protein [Labilithrix sp.]
MARFQGVPSRRILAFVAIGGLVAAAVSMIDTTSNIAQASPRSPSTAETASTTAAKRIVRKVSDDKTGHLEHPSRLGSLFARLQEIETRKATSDLRIVQFGDSHTASDYGTSVARARLAARFGDGGRGFIPLGQPYRRLFQAGEAMARGVGFEPDGAPLVSTPSPIADGLFGPSGVAMVSRAPGAFMSSELTAVADRFEIAYLAQPGGGSFDVSIDGQPRGRVTTGQATRASAFRGFEITRAAHTLEVKAVGDGAVRVFGVRLDDTAVGITFDSLGINGARASTPLAADEAHFAEQIVHAAPALAIVAYGTNEAGDSTTTPDEHASALRALVARIKKSAPDSACVVLGPPDRDGRTPGGVRTLGKLAEIITAQRRAADDAGCAFYDQFTAMGATDAIGRWSSESPPRARRDLVHLTRAGYAFLAEALVRDVVASYEAWKGESAVARR